MKKSRNAEEFSERLRLAMKNAGISQAVLARKMGTAWSTVARWQAGSLPRAKTLKEIADTLCVASRWLESGEGEMSLPASSTKREAGILGEPPTPAEALEQAESFRASLDAGLTDQERITSMDDFFRSHPAVAAQYWSWQWGMSTRLAKEFFASVRHLAELGAMTAHQIVDQGIADDLKSTSELVTKYEPLVWGFYELLAKSRRALEAPPEA